MKVTFVIPAYNAAAFLHPAVDSCLIQSHKDIEVIIVDDCSTDSTPDYLAWLEAQKDPRVRIVRNEKNLGRSASRNLGNSLAAGEIICVLDADDINAPKRAELMIPKFKAGAQFVHGAAHRMDAVGRDRGMMPTDVFNKDKALETLTNGIVHSSVAYTPSFAKRYPYQGGDVARLGIDDWACFIGAALDGAKFDYIEAPICAYRDGVGIWAERNPEEVSRFKKSYLEGLQLVKA